MWTPLTVALCMHISANSWIMLNLLKEHILTNFSKDKDKNPYSSWLEINYGESSLSHERYQEVPTSRFPDIGEACKWLCSHFLVLMCCSLMIVPLVMVSPCLADKPGWGLTIYKRVIAAKIDWTHQTIKPNTRKRREIKVPSSYWHHQHQKTR